MTELSFFGWTVSLNLVLIMQINCTVYGYDTLIVSVSCCPFRVLKASGYYMLSFLSKSSSEIFQRKTSGVFVTP